MVQAVSTPEEITNDSLAEALLKEGLGKGIEVSAGLVDPIEACQRDGKA